MGTKSDLVGCLEDLVTSFQAFFSKLLKLRTYCEDLSSILSFFRSSKYMFLIFIITLTFTDYATQVFLRYITSQLHYVSRLHVVWNEYHQPDIFKIAETQVKRGKGVWRCEVDSTTIPGNCQEFLGVAGDKAELLSFLATR